MNKSAKKSELYRAGGLLLILLLSLLPNVWAVMPVVASSSPASAQSEGMAEGMASRHQPQAAPSPTPTPSPETEPGSTPSPEAEPGSTPSPETEPEPTPSPETELDQFRVTLNELGYGERVLKDYVAQTGYTFVLPETWELQEGSYLELDFSYTYQALETQDDLFGLATFGTLTVLLDGEVRRVITLETSRVQHQHVGLGLPPDLLNDATTREHTVSLLLDASHPCELPHRVELVVHSESFFSFRYTRRPLLPDLGVYPRPFYQRAFDPDAVWFILPGQPSQPEIAGAIGVGAKLGELTGGRMVISTTTDLAGMENLESGVWRADHLILIGRPDTNKFIPFLNERTVLPISLQPRQLGLVGQGPGSASPGDVLTYTFTVTNTTPQLTSPLVLTGLLPLHARLVACEPACDTALVDRVSWSLDPLAPGRAATVVLTLQLADTLTSFVAENTIILSDREGTPLNTRTLTTTVDALAKNVINATATDQSDYFFVKDNQPIPETDGVVQEIVSPWNPDRAILMITGLTDEAVYKACQAMSTEAEFPGMAGPAASVSLVRFSPPVSKTLNAEVTLSDLGYGDKTVYGTSAQAIDYWFFLPVDWRLTEGAYVELMFSHSSVIDETSSSINLLFNGTPLSGEVLDRSNATNGLVKVFLSGSQAKPGANNRLTIQVDMNLEDPCAEFTRDQIWLTVRRDSRLYLDHRQRDDLAVDLDYFPIPFGSRSDLADLLFVLPPAPEPVDIEGALRLAAALGNMTNGKAFSPAVVLGDAETRTLSDYHIIALGRPSANPLIQQINAHLPQPFVPGTDNIEQRIDDVIFRLPPGVSLGYIQLLESPWNEERALLAVTGTTEEGVEWAVPWLTNSSLRWQLAGNLAMTDGDEVHTIDTRRLTSSGEAEALATIVPGLTPVATVAVTPTPTETSIPTTSTSTRPGWLMPVVAFMVLAVIVTFVVAIQQARRKRVR